MILAYVREIPSKKQVIFSHLSCPRFLRILSRYKRENNMYYIEENSEKSLESFLHNLQLAGDFYAFTQPERRAAPLLYWYLRPFWWRPLHALKRDQDCPEKVGKILDWIEHEQARDIDFERMMEGTFETPETEKQVHKQ